MMALGEKGIQKVLSYTILSSYYMMRRDRGCQQLRRIAIHYILPPFAGTECQPNGPALLSTISRPPPWDLYDQPPTRFNLLHDGRVWVADAGYFCLLPWSDEGSKCRCEPLGFLHQERRKCGVHLDLA